MTASFPQPTVWIVGAGPAGLALAAACAERGVAVGVVAPDHDRPWPNNYGLWQSEAEALGVGDLLIRSWPRTVLKLSQGELGLEFGYAKLDGDGLRSRLRETCEARGVRFVRVQIVEIEHHADGVTLVTVEGARLPGRLVVDASGHRSTFVEREPEPEGGVQVAWGELLEGAHPYALDEMVFMDWGSLPRVDDGLPPSFLYVMPLAKDRLFVEETVLVGRPPEGGPAQWFDPLRARLHRRLEGLGITGCEPLEVERCVIPMGGPLPRGNGRTFAFGGAAGMVHPATGYMLTNVLRRAERVAEALAAHDEEEELDAAARRIWSAIWPAPEVRAWRLYTFGMRVLLDLDHEGVEGFFAEFFELPPARWQGFLSATSDPRELMGTMLRYWGGAASPLRARLSNALVQGHGWRLAAGMRGLSG